MKKLTVILSVILIFFVFASCGKNNSPMRYENHSITEGLFNYYEDAVTSSPEKYGAKADDKNSITEAAKQCGRAKKPVVSTMLRFGDMINEISGYDLTLFCYEGEGASSLKATLDEYSRHDGRIAVIVGSEGGFSRDEADAIIEKGAKCVNLGPRILRCETAPTYCLASISYFSEL